jgi:hypothetical protein
MGTRGYGLTIRTSTSSPRRYREPDKFFPRAVKRAQDDLRDSGREEEAVRLEGVSWHGLRHTWASRLTMKGVDPRYPPDSRPALAPLPATELDSNLTRLQDEASRAL